MFSKPKPPPDHSLRWSVKHGLNAVGIPAILAASVMFIAVVIVTGLVIVAAPKTIAAIVAIWAGNGSAEVGT